MATVVAEGNCCECCALMITNGDESGCRDFYGHTHSAPMPEKIAEGHAVITSEETTEAVGSCDLCGTGNGYYMAHTFAIIR